MIQLIIKCQEYVISLESEQNLEIIGLTPWEQQKELLSQIWYTSGLLLKMAKK